MPFMLLQRAPSFSSAARLLPIAALVALGFLLIASSVGGQTGGDDHGNSFDTATLVELGFSVEGRIDPGDDRDVFKFDLSDASGPTDLWVYTRGEFDTYGGLYDSSGTLVALNDDGFFEDQIRAFSIRSVIDPGVYYVIAVSYLGESGDYTLHARAVMDPGSSMETAKPLVLGSHNAGTVDTQDGVDYFRLDFTETKHVIIDARTSNILPLDAALLDADGNEITANIAPVALRGFGALFPIGIEIAEDFGPGTYYLKVTSPGAPSLFGPPPEDDPETDDDSSRTVSYAIFLEEDIEYTELLEDCAADTRALSDPLISDPLYSCQWHLGSSQWQDINVQPVWEEGIKGEGINVAVVDDGMYHAHEDLKDNVNSELNHDYTGEDDIYNPFDHHGTNVTGMIAARDNDVGVRGVAPRATVYGYNILTPGGTTGLNIVDAMVRNGVQTAVSNNSWGPFDGPGPSPTFSFWRQAINTGITEGYDGKGIFYAFAGGNGHLLGDDSNLDEFANTHAVTAVCSVHSEGKRAGYSEMGANLWVCAPSNDRPGSLGGARGILTTENSDRYYHDFGGTSAATPLVAGVAALTRSANADLTWRDIKVILAASAQKNDPTSSGWKSGARKHPISSTDKYHFNHEYGFGVVNAEGAVALAKRWTNLPEMQDTTVSSGELYVEIPDATAPGSATTTTLTLTVDSDIGFTEFVEVTVAFEHDSFRDSGDTAGVAVRGGFETGRSLRYLRRSQCLLWRGLRAASRLIPVRVGKAPRRRPQRRVEAARHRQDSCSEWGLRRVRHNRLRTCACSWSCHPRLGRGQYRWRVAGRWLDGPRRGRRFGNHLLRPALHSNRRGRDGPCQLGRAGGRVDGRCRRRARVQGNWADGRYAVRRAGPGGEQRRWRRVVGDRQRNPDVEPMRNGRRCDGQGEHRPHPRLRGAAGR